MDEKITLDFQSWNIKQIERSRNRMKIQLKFNKEEALAIKNFMEMVKPPEIPEDDFMKGIFKMGVEAMEIRLMDAVKQHAEDNDLDLSAVGLEDTPIEDTPVDESTDELQNS